MSMTLGRDGERGQELVGALDEFRISSVVRYMHDFEPPASFSRNYGSNPPMTGKADGPPLLFDHDDSAGPIELGSRKHLFIDDVHCLQHDGTS